MSANGSNRERIPVTVVLPVLNEELNLGAALDSISWASEIVVIDSGSTDGTVQLAEARGARVVQFRFASGGPKKKAWSLTHLAFSSEWVLYLDADERVTAELKDELREAVSQSAYAGFYLDRQFVFRGRELRSYRPDWNLRLFRHSRATIEDLGLFHLDHTGDNEIHEHFIVEGPIGYLRNPLVHEDYRGIGPWIDRHNKYATWEAHLYRRLRSEPLWGGAGPRRDRVARNRTMRRLWVRLPARPLLRFLLWYVGKRAIRDGWRGLQYALLMGWYEFVISVKLNELERAALIAPPHADPRPQSERMTLRYADERQQQA